MKIYKEIACDDSYIGAATLENGVTVFSREDGTGDGTDGKRYYRVSKEVASDPMPPDPIWMFEQYDPNPIPDSFLADVGWTTEASHSIVLDELEEKTIS